MKRFHCTGTKAAVDFFLLLASGVVLLSGPVSASAQEKLAISVSDSVRLIQEPFYIPSMSPGLSYITPRVFDLQLSFTDRAMIGSDGQFSAYTDAWRRSFLLSASVYKTDFSQARHVTPGKKTFFQSFQTILGVAELAGVAFLGYKAIKEEPITKKK